MNQLSLPRFAWRRRDVQDVDAESAIPCTTAPRATAPVAMAGHLADDRRREPSFDDLIAGNDREPSHEDLLADDDEFPDAIRPEFKSAYPGVAAGAIAWLRSQDAEPTPPAAAAAEEQPAPAAAPATVDEPPTMPTAAPRLLFDALDALDRLPALHGTEGGSYQLATNAAAVLTYLALRPDLLARLDVHMMLAPALAELAEVTL